MAKYLQLKIDSPCSESWTAMQQNASGAFCSSCQKTVIDFTQMSDQQLLDYFKKHPADVCGRVYNDQLEKPLQIPVKKIPWMKYFVQITLPALLLSTRVNAQRLIKGNTNPIALIQQKPVKTGILPEKISISGKVSLSDGQPVSYASVMVSGTKEGTMADSNGVFSLQVNSGEHFLEITAAGYENKRVAITGTNSNTVLDIKMGDNVMLNEVSVTSSVGKVTRVVTVGAMISGTTITRSHINNKIKNEAIATPSITVFPNPVKRDGDMNIRWLKPVVNDQELLLYNATGQLVMEQTITIAKASSYARLGLHLPVAGLYFLELRDRVNNGVQKTTVLVY